MSNITILVGAQWGDEGKGKWIDILAKDASLVARYQGGNNAGHTLYINGKKIVLHQIPSGIFHEGQNCALTAGVVVNPTELAKEIQKVRDFASVSPSRLWLSEKAHVITPWHIYLDTQKEASSHKPIGTTKRGIGPTYAAKSSRTGLRLGNYAKEEKRQAWVEQMSSQPDFAKHLADHPEEWKLFHGAAKEIEEYICDAEQRLRGAVANGSKLLMEGAQGALLDIDHGTYPYVTSSSTCSGGAFASLGFSPRKVDKIYGVAKAYLTRVGEGPFPTELNDDSGKYLAEKGHEFGATTGRPRRCGWFDAVAMKYCQEVNGFDEIILNKMDVLTGLAEIKICIAYQHPTLGRLDNFPSDHEIVDACTPIYETFKGWDYNFDGAETIDKLPSAIQDYIAGVEKYSQCKVGFIGTGVGREDYVGH